MKKSVLDIGLTGNVVKILDLQDKIEKVAGTECYASGCGSGVRDMQFSYDSQKEARASLKKVKQFCLRNKINIEYATVK